MSAVNNPKNNTPPGSETSGLTPEAEKQNDRATSQVRARTPADPPAPHYVSHDPRGDPGRADQPWRAPTAVVEQRRDEAADGRTEGGQRVEPKPKGQGKDSLETDDDPSQCSQQQRSKTWSTSCGTSSRCPSAPTTRLPCSRRRASWPSTTWHLPVRWIQWALERIQLSTTRSCSKHSRSTASGWCRQLKQGQATSTKEPLTPYPITKEELIQIGYLRQSSIKPKAKAMAAPSVISETFSESSSTRALMASLVTVVKDPKEEA